MGWGVPHPQNPAGLPLSLSLPRKEGGNVGIKTVANRDQHACASIPACPMLSFLAKRILQLIPTLFFVSVLIFSLLQLLPGDPALVMAGEERDPNVIAQIRAQYRLDQPLPVQYFYWIKGVLSGDFGE